MGPEFRYQTAILAYGSHQATIVCVEKHGHTVLPELGAHHFLRGRNHVGISCNQETRLLARCVSVPSPAGEDMLETMTLGVELHGQKLFCASFLCSGCCTGYSSPKNGAGKTYLRCESDAQTKIQVKLGIVSPIFGWALKSLKKYWKPTTRWAPSSYNSGYNRL